MHERLQLFEGMLGILALIDDTRAKIAGTKLAEANWPQTDPDAADELAALRRKAMAHCEDQTEAVIVVTVAAVLTAQRHRKSAH